MISISNLSISYKRDQKVIHRLQLQMQSHCIHGIVGLNGSGKTTLLNCIFGLLKPDSGAVWFNDTRVSKKDTSYLPTENFFYSNITGKEYLNIFKNDSFDIKAWNSLFLLPLNDVIDTYSTGMKKKLAIFGILKTDKDIMIFDEPFNGLDIETSRIIRTVLMKLKGKGKTIIITSHIIETLTNMCDYIHYLNNGKIEYSKGKAEFENFEKEIFKSLENKNKELIHQLMD